jgi:hypothetical protein
MAFEAKFMEMGAEDVLRCAQDHKARGWRFVQLLCTNTEDGIDVQYTYMKDETIENWTVKGVKKGESIPSITDYFLAAFVFENESHDLFGIDIQGIAIDFQGRFYDVSVPEPMTVISPAQKAAREKAAKLAAAKAAKEKADAAPAADAELEAKLAGMDPEKAAKVRAAMEAKAKKAATAQEQAAPSADAELEAKLAGMDPEKAAKVRAAMEAKKAREAAKAAPEGKGE